MNRYISFELQISIKSLGTGDFVKFQFVNDIFKTYVVNGPINLCISWKYTGNQFHNVENLKKKMEINWKDFKINYEIKISFERIEWSIFRDIIIF